MVMGMNYYPEQIGIAPFTTELSKYLVENGHEVTAVTAFPHYPEWNVYPGYRCNLFGREMYGATSVFRVYTYIPKKSSAIERIVYDSFFSFSAFLLAMSLQQSDLIICICPPLFLGLSALVLSKLRGTPFLFHIQDLNIEAAIQAGMLKNSRILRYVYKLEKEIYRQAAGIGVISQSIAKNLTLKGVPKSKIHELPNWVNAEHLSEQSSGTAYRRQLGLSPENILVMYAGNLGNKQGLETLLDAAALLRERSEISFVISGDGTVRKGLEEKAYRLNITNVRFLGVLSASAIRAALRAADIFIITQKKDVVEFCLPSKLLSYSAAARPIIASINPESGAALFINESNSGLVTPPEDPEALAAAILHLASEKDLRLRLGMNAREYVANNFSKEKILPKFEEVIQNLVC